jgi:hypothetical protein
VDCLDSCFLTSVNIIMADQYTPQEIQAIFEEYNNATKGGSVATAELTKRFKDAQTGLKNYTDQLNASLKSLGSSMLGVAKAMKDGEQGASVYNDSINSAADAVDSFASKFGFLGKLIGTLITAGARYAVEVNKQSDALFDSYKKLSSSGLSDAGGMTTIFENMQKFGYGINELGNMAELLKANGKELAAFGGTAASGTKAFADAAGEIQRSDVGKSLQMLGKTPDEINKGMAMFVKQQQSAGVSSASIQQNLAQKSADYIKNLDLLSKLTGDDASKLQEKLDAAMAEDAFNQTVYELKKKAAAGDAEAGRLASEYENAARRLTGEALKEFQQGVGGDISAMGKTLMAASDAVGMIGKSSFTASGYIDSVTKGVVQLRNQQGELYKLNAAKDFMFSAKEASDLESRNAEKTAKSQEDMAKAQQELQTKGLEPGTKAAVELRIEQMKTRDEFQSLINKGINPVTQGMAKLAGGIETITDKIPGSGTSTGTQMGGGQTGSNWWNPSTWGKGGGAAVTGQSGALLDLIGKGESGGNYNALVGAKKGGPKVAGSADLTNMTIAEVQQMQKSMIGQGHASTAVGKYQMIADTLSEQVKKSGLDPSKTKFDQKTQDLLAQQLVDRAGYGKADTATVMKNLAGTWASLPKDMSGRGTYDGFNGNMAGIKPQDLVAAINDKNAINTKRNTDEQTNKLVDAVKAKDPAVANVSGPTNKYDSKMADVKPDKTLPTKEDVAANRPEGYDSEQTDSYNKLIALTEQSIRIQSDQADALGRIRQNTAV